MLQLLPNTVGAAARSFTNTTLVSASGYNQKNIISGPRSKLWRSTNVVNGVCGYVCDPATVSATHVVIARADYLLTNNGGGNIGTEVTARYYTGYAAGTPTTIGSTQTINDAGDLIGYNAQDWIYEFPSGARTGYGFDISQYAIPSPGTAHVFQISKLYFSNAFDFEVNPKHDGITWEFFPPGELRMGRPFEGTFEYACEARIRIDIPEIPSAKLDSFLALPEIFRWPLFLYDSSADVIPWKLEHVILERFEQTLMSDDVWSCSLSFLRLKHYP